MSVWPRSEVIWVNTWGISGPVFLLIYAGLLAATWAWVLAARQRVRAMPGAPAVTPGAPGLGPYEVAMLNGGGQLALAAAVCRLKESGSLTLSEDGKSLAVAGPLPEHADPVEEWLYDRVKTSAAAAPDVLDETSAAGVLGPVRDRLRDLGLMPTDRQVALMRWQVLWFAPLLVLGAARVVAGTANHRPVFFLIVLMALTVVIAINLGRQPRRVLSTNPAAGLVFLPRTTRAGTSLLKSLRTQSSGGAGSPMPGRGRLAAEVALTGIGALAVSDAALASMLSPAHTSVWSGGGGFGGGGGGCGGGGGGCGG